MCGVVSSETHYRGATGSQPELEHKYHNLTTRQQVKVRQLLEKIAHSYEADGRLVYDEQPVTSVVITIEEVTLVRQLVR